MRFATVLPTAFVMVAGPQILSAVVLATSGGAARNAGASHTALDVLVFFVGITISNLA